MLLHLGEPKTSWINIGLFGFGLRVAHRTSWFITRAEGDVLLLAGHRLEIIPLLPTDFLFAVPGREIHVTRLGLRVSVSPALRDCKAAPDLDPLRLPFARFQDDFINVSVNANRVTRVRCRCSKCRDAKQRRAQ